MTKGNGKPDPLAGVLDAWLEQPAGDETQPGKPSAWATEEERRAAARRAWREAAKREGEPRDRQMRSSLGALRRLREELRRAVSRARAAGLGLWAVRGELDEARRETED